METNHFNALTEREAEGLALLSEELGEAQQAIGKILRHGLESRNPSKRYGSNRKDLEKELGHISAAITILVNNRVLDGKNMGKHSHKKLGKVYMYLHHIDISGN